LFSSIDLRYLGPYLPAPEAVLCSGPEKSTPTLEEPMPRARTVIVAALSVGALMAPQLAAAAPARPAASQPGLVGNKIVLDNHRQYDGYDVATDAKGNAYIGWIANTSTINGATRAIHLCTLHPTSTSCAGGIKVINSLGGASAEGLRVLATASGKVTLVWFHDTTPGSVNGKRGGRIAIATSQSGTSLSAAKDVADAPSFGALLDAEVGPAGALWTVESGGSGFALEIHKGVTNPAVHLTTPWSVSAAELAFSGSVPVLAISKAGAISTPVSTSHGSSLSTFHPVGNTWVAAQFGLVHAKSGVRLMSSAGEASFYSPVVAKFTGSGFSTGKLIGDPNPCAPNAYDLVTDASGRLANATNECGKITVYNLPDAAHAAIVRWSAGGTVASGNPQIATTPSGRAYVAWSIESTNGNKLYVARALLPALRKSASKSVSHGRVTVTGPASCLPAVSVPISVSGRPATHWKITKRSLLLGSKHVSSTVNGAALKPATNYSLTGVVVFSKGSSHVTGRATLRFRTCPKL
jgi:hypothetical protein